MMAPILGDDISPVDVSEAPPMMASRAGRHARARQGRADRSWSTLAAVSWITLPRLAVAFVVSALTERTASIGSPGPAVHGVASGLLNWDAAHYLSITEHGYQSVFDTPFFPLQPLLGRLLAGLLGFPNATIAVSWIAFGFAIWGIIDVASRLTSRRGAIAAALLFAWNPVSIFLVTGYAQSLLVAVTIWSLRFCMERRWWAAAILAACASAVAPQGAFSGVVLVVGIFLAERGVRRIMLAVGWGLVSELGIIGYALYCRARFGDALEFEKSGATYWHDQVTYPLHVFFRDVVYSGVTGQSSPLFTVGHLVFFVDAVASPVALVAIGFSIYLSWRERAWILPTVLLVLGGLVNLSVMNTWGDGEARFISALPTVYLLSAVVFERLWRRSMWLVVGTLVPSAALAIYLGAQFNMVGWLT
jgi:hypothetical protein